MNVEQSVSAREVASANSAEVLARIEAELDLVDLIARQLSRSLKGAVDFDDLIGAGREGLLDAARRFEPARGVPFRSYANIRIRGAMLDGVRQQAALPRRAFQRVRDLEAVNQAAEGLLDVRPGPGSSPGNTELSLDEQVQVLATTCVAGPPMTASSAGGAAKGEAADFDTPEDQYAQAEIQQRLRETVADLGPPFDRVVHLYYFEGLNLEAIAQQLKLDRSWVGRLHSQALRELTRRLRTAL